MAYFTYSHIPNLLIEVFLLLLGWGFLALFGVEAQQLYWTILILAFLNLGISSFAVEKLNRRVKANLNQGEFEKKRLPVHENKGFCGGVLIFTNERCLLYKNGWDLEWWEWSKLKAIKIDESGGLFASKKILLEFGDYSHVFRTRFWIGIERLKIMSEWVTSNQ